MSATVIAIVISYFFSDSYLFEISIIHVAAFVGITALAALLGKLLGLLWARGRLLMLATDTHDMVVSAAQQANS